MSVRGKYIREVVPQDILTLLKNGAPEDAFLDFKRTLFHAGHPLDKLDEDKNDLARDFVAFANAQGGHIIVGIEEDRQHRASTLALLAGDQAEKIRTIARDVAISRTRPPVPMEIDSLQMEEGRFVVIARIDESQSKPHMWTYGDELRFVVRDNDRKRTMAYEEIRELFLRGPQEEQMRRLFGEVKSVRALLEDMSARLGTRG